MTHYKTTPISSKYAGTAAALLGAIVHLSSAETSQAAISITNFEIDVRTVSFDISGTLPDNTPPEGLFSLAFANPDATADPGYVIHSTGAQNVSFTGSQVLSSASTGFANYGDYFYLSFQNDFSAGEAIDGTVSLEWTLVDVFDPDGTDSIDVYWGYKFQNTPQIEMIENGTLVDSISLDTVPEPSSTALLGLAGCGLLLRRRRA
ncbi:hypothetical protein Rhal01_03730 [Rubritalea halochordaticola]|uniref:Ice-binding protein C-terminal domain-containing protein n=1 Tax=Rubritalea halochordaticola TaxID=714537 RepID=A0ABP9V4D4_9BACT